MHDADHRKHPQPHHPAPNPFPEPPNANLPHRFKLLSYPCRSPISKQLPGPGVVDMTLLSALQESLTSEPFVVLIAPAILVSATPPTQIASAIR